MRKSLFSVTGIVILCLLVLLINGISNNVFSRFYVDLTEEGLYSLSAGSERVLGSIQEPIALKFYFSKTDGSKYPAVKLYGTRVLDLLKEYDRQGGDKVTLEVQDPRPDSEEEEWAQKYGLQPMVLPTGEKLFFGLAAVNALGEEAAIPVFDINRQEYLEYDVTKLLYSLRSQEKPVVGIISSLDIEGKNAQPQMPGRPPMPAQPWILISQISKFAQVRFLPTDIEAIPQGVNVLLVIHPKNLPEQTQYAVDQYVVKGGSLFLAVDPYCGSDRPQTDPSNPLSAMTADRSSDLPRLLGTWGVKLKDKSVVGDINLATKVAAGQGLPESFVVWMSLADLGTGSNVINRNDVTASELESVMLAWSGALSVSKVEGIETEPLFSTTKEAMIYSEQDIRFSAENPEGLLRKYQRGQEEQVLAVRLTGKFKSSFAAAPGKEEEVEGKADNMSTVDGHVAQGVEDANVIIVADADFLSDSYSAYKQRFLGTEIVTLLNDNLIFAANAVENLSGSNDLISLRSRGRFTRPFTKVQEIEARAQDRWKEEEGVFQAQLNQANQRLSQLQSGKSEDGKTVFTKALVDEIRNLREQRKDAQQRLREVRRRLREDKEGLGTMLFVVNTFGIPVLLVVLAFVWSVSRAKRLRHTAQVNSGAVQGQSQRDNKQDRSAA